MDVREQGLPIEELRQKDIVEYLSKLGYEPAKIRSFNYWYLSPLRKEKTPSFKVNRKLNRWYDFGIGKGGNIIDFGILYFNCTVSDFLRSLSSDFSSHQPLFNNYKIFSESKENTLKIIVEKTLFSYALYNYLQQRKIPFEVAKKYCKEVTYELSGKQYFGIGFKNDSGGYEIRNPHVKLSSSPKDITTFNIGSKEALVFEGFTDFLSFISIQKNSSETDKDFVILNSVSFFEKARPFMEQHETIKLYLDRDTTGQNYSRYALSLSDKYRDESSLYEHHKDFNDWVMNFGKSQRKSLGQKLQ